MTIDPGHRVASGSGWVSDMTVYSAEHLDPELSSWPAKLACLADPNLQRLRETARRRLVETAEQFVFKLSETGRNTSLINSH